MKLSEAIRLGSMVTTQAFRVMAVLGEDGQIISTCALGAAYLGAGDHDWNPSLHPEWGLTAPVRQDGHCYASLMQAIMFLNDEYCLTREAIAQIIETEVEAARQIRPHPLAAVYGPPPTLPPITFKPLPITFKPLTWYYPADFTALQPQAVRPAVVSELLAGDLVETAT